MIQRGQASTPHGPSLPTRFLIDGFNVLHSIVLRGQEREHWWSALNQERVVRLAESFTLASRSGGPAVEVVFDARSATSERFTGKAAVEVRFSPNADDAIVARSQELQGRFHVIVVSADRALLDRARNFGAARLSPWAFEEACGGPKAP